MVAEPDRVVDLVADYCKGCGASLAGIDSVRGHVRQVVDIPPISAVVTEYRAYARTCACGCGNMVDFPKGVDAPVGYGDNIEALIGYFHARQYLPFKRMREMFADVMGIGISEGGLQ